MARPRKVASNAKPKGNTPDYRLKMFNKMTDEKGEVGAGWLNEDGSISIRLNPCVQLSNDNPAVSFRLWPL